ncbi:MAG: 4Fe-4S dicluster domain-containing protein [Candidatus Bipolaricaulota bacterium]|nr:MAG: 4Fe-4S dicluster domain-containing protein [Candidatus Bipolaricaulota bacterium]
MNERIVPRDAVTEFALRIAPQREIVGPTADRTGIRYDRIEGPFQLCLDAGHGVASPKGVLFPQTEVLFRFPSSEPNETIAEPRERVLFGIRPCDARALALLDRIFQSDGVEDPYFSARYAATTIVSLSCTEPGPACFCTSVGGGPADPAGSDLLLIGIGERLLARPVTQTGRELLESGGDLAQPAASEHVAAAVEAETQATAKIEPVEYPTDLARLAGIFHNTVWDEIAATCIGCGVCTYVCPTCHCFDITDEARRGRGRRVRSWDSCAFPSFTLHGSGRNPRERQAARLRQRILHKFLYGPERYGEALCVGCGRCITGCPTGIDLRSLLEAVTVIMNVEGA